MNAPISRAIRPFVKGALAWMLATAGIVSSLHAGLVLSGGGLTLVEQGGTFAPDNLAAASAGAIPIGSSSLGPEIGVGFHVIANANDGTYGNSNSWIGGTANPYPRPFIGVALDGASPISSFAFGRDNLGTFSDRNLGLYELQYTTAAFPDANTPDASWTSIGTLDYQSPGTGNFSAPQLRHRYNFTPIANATGVRLIVPGTGLGGGTAVDELELYATPGVVVPPPPNVVLTPSAGFGIGFNGNNGPTVPASPAPVPDNLALASHGSIPIGSSALGPELGIAYHQIANINDGFYANNKSWIGGSSDTAPFIGVVFDGPVEMDSVAWGRDNGDATESGCTAGTCMDRSSGLYTLQITRLANPDGSTPDTGNPATGWATFSTVDYRVSDPGVFDPFLRHQFTVSENGAPILATGFRIKPPLSGIAGGTAIDEIEVYGRAVPEPSTIVLAGLGLLGLAIVRRRKR
jgi:hypothetical protein